MPGLDLLEAASRTMLEERSIILAPLATRHDQRLYSGSSAAGYTVSRPALSWVALWGWRAMIAELRSSVLHRGSRARRSSSSRCIACD